MAKRSIPNDAYFVIELCAAAPAIMMVYISISCHRTPEILNSARYVLPDAVLSFAVCQTNFRR